jgi:hypothetical protein
LSLALTQISCCVRSELRLGIVLDSIVWVTVYHSLPLTWGRSPARHSVIFYASNGANRFACYVPYEDIAARHRVPVNANLLRLLNQDIEEVQRLAEAAYRARGLDADGGLLSGRVR